MAWTAEKVRQVPEIYRDFMTTLNPVVESRRGERVLKFYGFTLATIGELLLQKHDVDTDQVQELVENLQEKNLVAVDEHGFVAPTSEGEAFILALNEAMEGETVPPFPDF
jgi:hypothetical protein